MNKQRVISMMKEILVILFITCLNIFIIFCVNSWETIDGDFNGYFWGAKLSGIAEALKYGELRLWNPNIWSGISGIHNFTDSFYPISLLICKIFWDPEKELLSFMAYPVFLLFHSVIGTCGFYYLLKEIKFSGYIGIIAILIGTPLVIVYLTSLQMCWIPMFGLLFLKAYKKKNIINIFSILSGLVFGLFLLMSLSQGAVLGVLLVGILYLVAAYIMVNKKDYNSIKKITIYFLFVGIIGIGIGAVNLFPILAQQSDMLRFTSDGFVSLKEALPISSFYENPVNIDWLRQLLGAKAGTNWLGIITLLFCLTGMFAKENYNENLSRYVFLQFGKVLYIFIIFASISAYFPEIFSKIPFVNMVRETYLYAGLLPFATTILSSYGIYVFYAGINGVKSLDDLLYNSRLMFILDALVVLQYILANYNNKSIWMIWCTIIVLTLSIVLKLKNIKNKRKIIFAFLLLLGVFNLWHISQAFSYKKGNVMEAKEQYDKVVDSYKKLQFFMESNADGVQGYRVMTWGSKKGCFSANSMVDVGGYFTQGYWEPIYRKTIDFHLKLQDLNKRVVIDNVLFFAFPESEYEEYYKIYMGDFLNQNFEFVGNVENIYPNYDAQEGQTICVYKNKNYVGDAWFVYDYRQCNNETSTDEQISILNDSLFSVYNTALVEVNDTETENFLKSITRPNENASVVLKKYTNNTIKYECNTAGNGILVTAESDAKGWKVYVDGKKQEVLTVNYGKRGVLLEQGAHTVEFVYSPNSYVLGGVVAIVTVVGCFSLLLIFYLKRKKNDKK